MDHRHKSWRCAVCDVNWQPGDLFETCRLCGRVCYSDTEAPLSMAQGEALVRVALARQAKLDAFEQECVDREVEEFRAALDDLPEAPAPLATPTPTDGEEL